MTGGAARRATNSRDDPDPPNLSCLCFFGPAIFVQLLLATSFALALEALMLREYNRDDVEQLKAAHAVLSVTQ